jgi:hypothetical protein
MKIGEKELRITPSSFEEALDLKDAVENSIRSGKIKVDAKINLEDPLKTDLGDETIGSILNSVLSIDSSKDVRERLFICAERALLGEEKINKDFFDKVENREFYYPIMLEILKVNLIPFFKGLFSGSLINVKEKIINFLKQK